MPSRTPRSMDPTGMETIDENGKAPGSRLSTAYQVWNICHELEEAEKGDGIRTGRANKRTRIYKAYNRFPPTEYSTIVLPKEEPYSNVNWGMMAFVVDNNVSSFFDMLTERHQAADIVTKSGNTKERKEWSDTISSGFDRALRQWDDFLINQEQAILDMGLYGKGVEISEDADGWTTTHLPAGDLLVPDSLNITFNNFDVIGIKRRYSLHELYKKIKDKDTAKSMGWNVGAVIDAIRYQNSEWHKNKTQEEFTQDVAEGNVTLGSHLKETVDVYILFAKEFDGKISKYIVLRDYSVPIANTNISRGMEKNKTAINREGFLFKKIGFCKKIQDVLHVFMDSAGSGKWHKTPSLAEKIFVQCRQYDIVMNAMMDAIKVNMSLLLQGQSADASEKLKEIVFNPITLIPSDIPFVQQRVALPVQEASITLQMMMGDMYRGIGSYRVHEKGASGEALTATQSKLDAAENAKLTGTQLKRFSGQHSLYYRKIFKRFVECKEGEEGHDIYKAFVEYMDDNGVPKEAYQWKNIESIDSNMLAGAGSPSYKLMAAEKTIELTNISPRDEGQGRALDDALAALHGRSNVRRYREKPQPDPTIQQRIAGFENELMSSPTCSPDSVQVYSVDNHMEHIPSHQGKMAAIIVLVNQKLDEGSIDEQFAKVAMQQLLMVGAHTNGHMGYLARDPSKQEMLKRFAQGLSEVQKGADQLSQKLGEMFKQEQAKKEEEGDPTKDPAIRREIALGDIRVSVAEKLANIKLSSRAEDHQQKMESSKDIAANQIAIERTKALSEKKDNGQASK